MLQAIGWLAATQLRQEVSTHTITTKFDGHLCWILKLHSVPATWRPVREEYYHRAELEKRCKPVQTSTSHAARCSAHIQKTAHAKLYVCCCQLMYSLLAPTPALTGRDNKVSAELSSAAAGANSYSKRLKLLPGV